MSSGEGSDIELQSALPAKNKKKMPKSPTEGLLKKKATKNTEEFVKKEDKKLTTKSMLTLALVDLNTRKGVSLYAIKKYLNEKFSYDTEKNSYLVKKTIKKAIEDGLVIQTKGIGASGSFKIAPIKDKKAKTKKKIEKTKKIDKKVEKTEDGETQIKEKKDKIKKPKSMKKVEKKIDKVDKKATEKAPKVKKQKDGGAMGKKEKVKMAKGMQTPAKKRAAMMKRKSIGSIIKPPKMKPKSKV